MLFTPGETHMHYIISASPHGLNAFHYPVAIFIYKGPDSCHAHRPLSPATNQLIPNYMSTCTPTSSTCATSSQQLHDLDMQLTNLTTSNTRPLLKATTDLLIDSAGLLLAAGSYPCAAASHGTRHLAPPPPRTTIASHHARSWADGSLSTYVSHVHLAGVQPTI